MSDKVEIPRELLEKLAKDPDYIKKAQRSSELDEFKTKYSVTGSSSLRCPACNQYGQSGGALWGPMKGTSRTYVCRKCRLEWIIDCLTKPNEDVIKEVKETNK